MKRILLIILLSYPILLFGKESIRDFSEEIFVHKNREGDIFLHIDFLCEGKIIKHGLYLDFFEKWKDEQGKERRYIIKIIDIKRDGFVEKFHISPIENGFRVYIGSPERLLSRGVHSYDIHLAVYGIIQSYKQFDQLYWTVVGTNWILPIEQSEAIVHLPSKSIPFLKNFTGYIGKEGEKSKVPTVVLIRNQKEIKFLIKRIIYPGNGFTIAVTWKKGFFVKENFFTKYGYIFKEHRKSIILFILLFLYYFVAWLLVGKDPNKGVIIPLYYPPSGISPGGARYILNMGYDKRVLVADIIDLAVKGYLNIKDDDGDISLIRTGKSIVKGELTKDEEKLMKTLFSTTGELFISRLTAPVIQESERHLKRVLASLFEGKYFVENLPFFIVGLVLSVVVLVVTAFEYSGYPFLIFLSVWILIWSIGVTALLKATLAYFKMFLASKHVKDFVSFSGMLLFSLPFIAGELIGFFFMWRVSDIYFPILVFLVILLGVVFYHLLKAPTRLGRKVMDKIEGFKLYLKVAEKEKLEALARKIGYETLYEKYLPYAVAFDLEKGWGEKFDLIFTEMGRSDYAPVWYSGGVFIPSVLGSTISNAVLTSIMSSTTTSGSGVGGGGVGGGGGGGGGGGW